MLPRLWSYRQITMVAAIMVTLLLVYRWYTRDHRVYPPCPGTSQAADKKTGPSTPRPVESSTVYGSARPVDCAAIFRRDPNEIHYAEQFRQCRRDYVITTEDYVVASEDCDWFRRHGGYGAHKVTDEERDFPLAFSILMYEQPEQVERLLRLIYRPQNVYCINVDVKASTSVHLAMRAITSCLDNVFLVSRPVSVYWAEFSLLQAELRCLEDLWVHPVKWKYFINLTGREFPLKTNWQLVQILKAYGGANDIDGSPHKRPIAWTQYVYRREWWRTSQLKEPVPHGFVICKGSSHIAASREFIDFTLHDERARDLLVWMKDIRAPDEHYFQTLNHNPQMGIPGSYKGVPDLKWFYTRLKIWQDAAGEEQCAGEWMRFICNLGTGDLYRVVGARQLFVNKLRLEMYPLAFQCLEEWYKNMTLTDGDLKMFDVDFYKQLDFARNHV